jgi:hypothetical protein
LGELGKIVVAFEAQAFAHWRCALNDRDGCAPPREPRSQFTVWMTRLRPGRGCSPRAGAIMFRGAQSRVRQGIAQSVIAPNAGRYES